jgi:vacuolar-type H+-ATPase subunit H
MEQNIDSLTLFVKNRINEKRYLHSLGTAKEAAEREARETIERAELEGREAAEAHYDEEMNGLEREIERLRSDAGQQEEALRSAGDARVSDVADELVRYVAPVAE